MPNLAGLDLSEAKEILAEAGLKLGRETEAASDKVPAGEPFEQDPPAETEVAADTAVNVTVSSGPGGPASGAPGPEDEGPAPTPEDPEDAVDGEPTAGTPPASETGPTDENIGSEARPVPPYVPGGAVPSSQYAPAPLRCRRSSPRQKQGLRREQSPSSNRRRNLSSPPSRSTNPRRSPLQK